MMSSRGTGTEEAIRVRLKGNVACRSWSVGIITTSPLLNRSLFVSLSKPKKWKFRPQHLNRDISLHNICSVTINSNLPEESCLELFLTTAIQSTECHA